MNHLKKWIALLLIPALLLAGSFAAAESQPEQGGALGGSPWINSTLAGNLPGKAPAAVDDFYLSVNYDELQQHQNDGIYTYFTSHTGDVQDSVLAILHDESVTDPEMEQLRIFFRQASDLETLEKDGTALMDEYVKRIRGAANIQELNAVLLAEDFPFSPYLFFFAVPESLRGKNIIGFVPALSLTDDPMHGVDYYTRKAGSLDEFKLIISPLNLVPNAQMSMVYAGVAAEQAEQKVFDLYNTEVEYASLSGNTKGFLNMEYGGQAESVKYMTAEELDALSPSFPLTGTLKKFGKGKSPVFYVVCPEWIKALNTLWSDENFETVQLLTAFKVIQECSQYIDQKEYNKTKQTPVIGEGNGWKACNAPGTFGQLLGKLYAEKVLGNEVSAKLKEMAEGLIEQYRVLFRETDWIGEKTRAAALEKLDNMSLNILSPKDGAMDYSGLKLKTAEEGGTLLGNYLTLKAYRNNLENEMIGQPATADMAWRVLSPTTANAFYDPQSNSINIMPGFVTKAFWREGISEMELLGGIGTVVAHEIGHGFDFSGSQYNAFAEPKPIMEGDDLKGFLSRMERIVAYYNGIESYRGVYVNGNDLKMENAADLVGLKAAVMLAASRENADLKAFFDMYAKIYVMAINPYFAVFLAQTDTHAPDHLRVNVNVQMLQQFIDTYGVKEGDGMYIKPEDRLNIWGK